MGRVWNKGIRQEPGDLRACALAIAENCRRTRHGQKCVFASNGHCNFNCTLWKNTPNFWGEKGWKDMENIKVNVVEQENGDITITISKKEHGRKIGDVEEGTLIRIAGMDFIVLEKEDDMVAVIKAECWKDMAFGETNNYEKSEVREALNTEFLQLTINDIGEENIIKHKVDLTSDDGLKDYGECEDRVSLITCDRYRKYRGKGLLGNINDYWWTATPWSTESNGYKNQVRIVLSSGALNSGTASYNGCAVRPFMILNSSTSVQVVS